MLFKNSQKKTSIFFLGGGGSSPFRAHYNQPFEINRNTIFTIKKKSNEVFGFQETRIDFNANVA